MKLTFCGKQPLQRFFRIGVVGNNLADELVMVINKVQGNLRLDEFTPFIKIVNRDLTFVDKTRHFIFDVDTDPEKVRLIYVFPKKVTKQRNVDMQVLFQKSENDDTIIWQTEIFNATFDLEIDANEIIEQIYPDELQELDYRITALEQKRRRRYRIYRPRALSRNRRRGGNLHRRVNEYTVSLRYGNKNLRRYRVFARRYNNYQCKRR